MVDQAVIFCGGFGRRLLPITNKIPKPMVRINKKPFLYYLIEQCKINGIKNILLLCGYKKKIISDYFGNGYKYGVKIKYHYNPPDVQTLKRLIDARRILKKEFLLLYSDNYSDLNLHQLKKKYDDLNSSFLITVCEKSNGNIILDKKNQKIKKYFFQKEKTSNFVEIGYMILKKKILPKKMFNKELSFNSFVSEQIIKKKVNYSINNRYLSISDNIRYKNTKKYFNESIILVDRDGVLNEKNKVHYYVRNLNELKINKGFIKKYRKGLKDKKLICITNQAGVSTGDVSEKNLTLIHKSIKKTFKKLKINIIDFFISKHHFTSKHIDRKPGPGLFLKASEKYKFILDRTTYIGDDKRDIEASYNAKCQCIYIGKKKLHSDEKIKYEHTLTNEL